MKTCTACLIHLPNSAFYKEKQGRLGLRSKCKSCMDSIQKLWNKTHKNKKAAKAGAQKRKKRNRDFVRSYLETHPCVDCGEVRWQVLEFDHVRGRKTDNIAWMIIGTRSLETISKEMAKCEVRCANCHRLKTSKQFGWYST